MEIIYNGETITLPEWCKDWSEAEQQKAAKAIYEVKQNEEDINNLEYDNTEADDTDQLIDELLAEGFNEQEVEEIIAKIACGHTIDSAIQRMFI